MCLRSHKKSFTLFFFSSLVLFSHLGIASDVKRDLAVAAIPANLTTGADAVVRLDNEQIQVISPKEVKIDKHIIITLLNAAASGNRYLGNVFSSLQTLDDISATIYDASGKEVKNIRSKDFKVRPLNVGSAGYSDVKVREYIADYAAYPFTIEFSTSTTLQYTFQLPSWTPQDVRGEDRVGVESARLKVIAPSTAGFRYKLFNVGEPVVKDVSPNREWTWKVGPVPPLAEEILVPADVHRSPAVYLSLDNIALDIYSGSGSTWASLGTFIWKLNEGRDILTSEDKAHVHTLTNTLTTDKEKINALYKYMQGHTRYVLVTLGIGGWQTLDASFVGKNQYGDCKALSNYMMALLKEAGITAYPVIISAGEDYSPLVRDFPSTYFNHEILCVPAANDTVWLECTSSNAPAGYLGSFTQNRDALMFTPKGGVVVHTPSLNNTHNYIGRHIHAKLNADMACEMKIEITYYGNCSDKLLYDVQRMPDADLRQYVSSKFTLPAYTVKNYHYDVLPPTTVPVLKETVDMTATGVANASEKRLFLDVNLMPYEMPDVQGSDSRSTDFYLAHSYAISDTIEIEVPKGKVAEYIPDNVKLESAYGNYTCAISFKGELVIMYRKLIIKGGTFKAKDYPAYAAFIDKINHTSKEKLVLQSL